MAIYKLNSKKKKDASSRAKKITGFTFIGASSLVFLFMTGIVPVLQRFLLGVFGVFGFPLCIIMFVIGLALVNNRKYVMPKRYTACLILSVFFLLCILQLAIVGNNRVTVDGVKSTMNFWKYMAKNYNCHNGWTAGGFLVGIFTTILLYIATIWGSFIIYVLALVICVALMVDSLNHMRKNQSTMGTVSVQIKDNENKKKVVAEPVKKAEPKVEAEEVNVVLNGKLEQEKKQIENKPMTAKQILGLDKKRNRAYEYEEKSVAVNTQPAKKAVESEKPKSLRELILTPPEIDIDEYFKNVRRGNDVPEKAEVNETVQQMKQETFLVEPSKVVHEDEFKPDNNPVIRRSLPEVKAVELVEQADDILRSVIEEEKGENPELYENVDVEPAVDPERNLLDRLPERNNSGSFERTDRDTFDRRSFERETTSNFAETESDNAEQQEETPSERPSFDRNRFMRLDRGPVTQEDKDARDAFNRDFDRISRVNGSLSRQQQPIEPEQEEEPYVPYEYEKPSLDFITTKSVDLSTLNEEVAEKRVALENALEMFGVPAKVQGVVVGPAVTRYELEMPQGVSVSKIKSHVDDIAYALAAEGAIRVEAPVPGKSVVGIEVPNASIATISLRDILDSSEFKQASSPLTFAIGKDITGRVVCANMQKLTHLLVAGSTGSGKSVCLNSIILSIIYKATPEDVKIVLIDPKRVEFSSYEALPHLIMPKIVCDTQKAISTLAWAVDEMEKRFEILGNARVKNIDEFNQTKDVVSGKIRKMPFIVIIVDELADLMMTGKKEVEDKVCRLAQKARAAGIHLILATQRPSVDVITGLIKSNFPSRISFSVTSAVDSMTILDRVGAEKLLGKGDMLYFPNGAKDPSRIQGCFIGTNEINNIVDFVRDNNEPCFDKSIEEKINNPNSGNGGSGGSGKNDDMDPLLPQVLKASIDAKVASATMIRRRFAIGYPRAARIIDQMEEAGYISSADGVKPRTVYITEEEFNDIFGDVDY